MTLPLLPRLKSRAVAGVLLSGALLAVPAVAVGQSSPPAKSAGSGPRVTNAVDGEWRLCPYTGDHPELTKGHANDAVGHVQCVLNKVYGYRTVSIDKIFGDGTLAAVKDFQTSVGLPADGYVGPNTWTALHP